MSSVAADFKKELKQELQTKAQDAIEVGKDAVVSHAYLYPIQGIFYLLNHQTVWGPVRKVIVPRLVLSVVVLIAMFTFTYIPQSLLLGLFSGPFGFIGAVPLVLSEANVIISILARFLDTNLDQIFDQVLLDQGYSSLVSHGREISGGRASTKAKLVSPLQKFAPDALARYLLTLPLNLIPAIGTVVFFVLNGSKAGPSLMSRYYQLKKMDAATKAKHIEHRQGAYTAFGTAVVALNLVPVVSQLFTFTNVIGAALWAADMERKAGNVGNVGKKQM